MFGRTHERARVRSLSERSLALDVSSTSSASGVAPVLHLPVNVCRGRFAALCLVMDKETDFPARVPRTPAEFAEVGKVLPSADYERLNKPYQPLPEGCVLEKLVALRTLRCAPSCFCTSSLRLSAVSASDSVYSTRTPPMTELWGCACGALTGAESAFAMHLR